MVAWSSLNRNYWYDSTLNLTLDTVSVVVTQYNNTAITTSNTIYGNFGSVNASTVTQAQSLAASLFADFQEGGLDYDSTSIRFGNATEGKVDGSVTIPYPTPYLAIDGFQYVSVTAQVDGCPPGQLKEPNDTCTCIMDTLLFAFVDQDTGYPRQGWGLEDPYPQQSSVIVPLTSTYYEALSLEHFNLSNIQEFFAVMESNTGTFNSASFLNFLSAASVFKSYPALSSCAFYNQFNGPPLVMISASALTTTVKTTNAGIGQYGSSTAKPASPVQATTVPQTAGAPSPTPPVPATQVSGSVPPGVSPGLLGSPPDEPELPSSPEVPSPNSLDIPKKSPGLPGAQSIAGPSVTAVQHNPAPVVGTSTQVLADVSPAQGAPNRVQSVPMLTVDGSIYQADQASHFVIAGQTVAPGGVITISGTPIAIDADASIAVIGSSTQSLSKTVVTPRPLLTFAGTTYTADDSTNFIIAGETLLKGGTVDVEGTQLSLDQAGTGVLIGTSTQLLSLPGIITAAEPVLTFDGSTYTVDSSSEFIINGQTLSKGGTIAVDGTQLSYEEAGTRVIVGTSTQLLGFSGVTTAADAVLTFDGSTYTVDSSSEFIVHGQTLSRGGIITVDGTQLSYDEAGTAVVVGTSTQMLSYATITAVAEPILTFDGSTYIADSSSNFVIDGQTLVKGDAITVDGTELSYDQAGTDVVIGTSTQMLSTTSIAAAQELAITFDGSTYYANPSSDFVIDGQTLIKGGVITVDGTPISYAFAGTDVVVGTSTEAVGLGGYIMSGLGGGASSSSGSVQFTGKAARKIPASWSLRFILGGLIVHFSL